MPVPNTFANATATIPLSQLDANFATTITLGNTAIQLGNTVSTLNNMTLANVTVTSGNVTLTNVSVTTANVTTANIATAQIANVTVSGTSTFAAGSNTAPSITFTGDTNTGIYSPGADQVAIATGGTAAVTVNSSQNVGVGTASPSQLIHMRAANPFLLVEGTAASTGETGVYLKANNNEWILRADNNGSSNFFGIKLGNPSSSSNTFLINSGGTVILSGGSTSATGVGITFPATQSASSDANTLDDYEEGTWTPSGATGFPAGGQPSSITATYTKIGNMVSVRATFVGYNDGTSLLISGLPFTVSGNCAASISNSTPNAFSYERVEGTGFYCTISGTNASNKTWFLEATYRV